MKQNHRMRKQKNILLLLGLLCGILPLTAQDNIIDEVVWTIGDEPILKSDVENQRLAAEIEGVNISGNPYCTIPEQLAIQKLFIHQASIDSIEVTDADVLRQLDYRLNYYLQVTGSKEKLEEYMHKPMAQIRAQMMEQIRAAMTTEKMRDKLTSKVKVTPAEVRAYFKNLPQDSLPLIPTRYEVQIITLTPQPDRSEVERVENELREYSRRVTSGESDFATLALLYSDDKGSARQGGLLPFSGKTSLVPEFANVAFSLSDPTKVSKIVKTEYGYHIIQFVARQGDKIQVRHILRKPIISTAAKQKASGLLDSLAVSIRSGKEDFDQAALDFSDDKDTRNNKGLMVSKDEENYAMSPWFELKDLPTEIAGKVASMKEGDVSNAFTYINKKDQEVCAIVKLKSKNESHRASMTEDYQTLKNLLVSRRQQETIDKWIKEKQKTTYIRIKEGWRNCDFKYPGWIVK